MNLSHIILNVMNVELAIKLFECSTLSGQLGHLLSLLALFVFYLVRWPEKKYRVELEKLTGEGH